MFMSLNTHALARFVLFLALAGAGAMVAGNAVSHALHSAVTSAH